MHALTRNDVRVWIATLDCSNKKIANILSPLRAALQDAYLDDLIPANPLHGWTYKRNDPPPKKHHIDPFTDTEQAMGRRPTNQKISLDTSAKKAKVRYRNPYQTRHTYASMMLSAGEDLAWVSSQMGHSNVLITARTYARWLNDDTQRGNKALDMF